ncbi:ParB/RepB/Spo0J family partition protein [Streptomyces sp. NPDC020489]|uniref:ParB/RepB/Spo0J family partition protein n=1 Tax=Streptomyces sp. NPDC020489 TaxID=3365077 RepID=UPI0037B3CBDF
MDESKGKQEPRRPRTRSEIANGEGRRPPAAVALSALAHNPHNPREELTDIEETAASLKAKGQIQPVSVARRAAFLNAHPGLEEKLGEADYVVIDGNRRLAAAPLAGLTQLRIDVNDDLVASAEDTLEAALVANIHRVDVPPLDQARAIQQLLAKHGSQGEVARRLGKSGAWVSQRLALLELPEDLQEKVETKELSVKDGRRIGRLPKDQQQAEAEKALNRVKAPRQKRGASTAQAADVPHQPSGPEGRVNPVNAQASETAAGDALNPVNTPASEEADDQSLNLVNDSASQNSGQPRQLPYDDAPFLALHLQRKMEPGVFVQFASVVMGSLREQDPEAYGALLAELTQREQQSV